MGFSILVELQMHQEPATHEVPQETDGLMSSLQMEELTSPTVMSNGYASNAVTYEHHQPHREKSKATPSQKSYISNSSSAPSNRSTAGILKYERNKLQNIGVLGEGIQLQI